MQNEPINNIESLFDRTGDYVETRLELFKLKATHKISEVVGGLVSKLASIFVILIFLMIANIGIALVLGEWLGKTYYGFFALAGVYLVAGLIFNASKDKLVKGPVTDLIIKKITT